MEDYKKKYERALYDLEIIKNANKDNKELVAFIEHEYPELKESEDERIRKALLNEFINLQSKGYKFAGLEGEEIIAWLEKQGEKKPAWSEEDEKYYDSALWHIKNSSGIEGNIYNWLKSLRERMKGE